MNGHRCTVGDWMVDQWTSGPHKVMPRFKLNRHKKQKKLAAFCALWLHILNMISWYVRAVHTVVAWNNTSGFGWDYNNDMLDAPQPVWQAYIQVHKNASKWRGKKFPHYWDLCVVFGKDRANGRDAQTAADLLFDINREEEPTEDGLDDLDVAQTLNNPSYANSREESSTQRKRKRRNSWDPLMNSLKESAELIGAEIREATNTFNRVFGTESNREEMRNNLFAEMNKVEGLTIRECDRAVCKLAQKEELMVVFFKVDEERKLGWVKNMLGDTT
ncbi:hypothetical protein E3N88_42243 [Mikania micrantha]|uniref:Myb/SANT-like domain-containing protein n=1 Tax=Mikania micrantha TaxID=192012 RepID=A0A5N6LIB5_9ASTR|nr:hypothetical protein E3N88_42243 [Mikania micrantha]